MQSTMLRVDQRRYSRSPDSLFSADTHLPHLARDAALTQIVRQPLAEGKYPKPDGGDDAGSQTRVARSSGPLPQ